MTDVHLISIPTQYRPGNKTCFLLLPNHQLKLTISARQTGNKGPCTSLCIALVQFKRPKSLSSSWQCHIQAQACQVMSTWSMPPPQDTHHFVEPGPEPPGQGTTLDYRSDQCERGQDKNREGRGVTIGLHAGISCLFRAVISQIQPVQCHKKEPKWQNLNAEISSPSDSPSLHGIAQTVPYALTAVL